jgi:hypothetical protein
MGDKAMTMMRLGELQCFDEQQRIDIFEMVKQGAITIEVCRRPTPTASLLCAL